MNDQATSRLFAPDERDHCIPDDVMQIALSAACQKLGWEEQAEHVRRGYCRGDEYYSEQNYVGSMSRALDAALRSLAESGFVLVHTHDERESR